MDKGKQRKCERKENEQVKEWKRKRKKQKKGKGKVKESK